MFGEALSAPGGMDRIRARMGVCPQFDILWHELTGTEHVRLYGAIKVGCRRHGADRPYDNLPVPCPILCLSSQWC